MMNKFQTISIMLLSGLSICAAETAGQQAPAAPTPPVAPSALPKAHVGSGHGVHGEKSAYLGVNIEEVTPERASALKLQGDQGVEITLVDQDAPAGKAGLRPHDVVVSYNGTRVEGEEQFRRLIRETPVGHSAQLGIMRDGQPLTVQATMGSRPAVMHGFAVGGPGMFLPKVAEMPEMPEMPEVFDAPGFEGFSRSFTPRMGIVAETLTPQLSQFFGAKEGEGLLVRSVEKGSAAEQSGLRAGDVITKINGETVNARSDLRRAFRGKAGSLSMTVLRDKREQTLTIKVPEQKHSEMLPEDFGIDMKELNAEMDKLKPQLEQIKLLAKNEAMKYVNSEAFRKQMQETQREIEKNLKGLRIELQELQ